MCECIVAGDFNVDLDSSDAVAKYLTKCAQDNSLIRYDDPRLKVPTYVNNALGHSSCIVYLLALCPSSVCHFTVLDLDVNFSDHLPLKVTLLSSFSASVKKTLTELYLR